MTDLDQVFTLDQVLTKDEFVAALKTFDSKLSETSRAIVSAAAASTNTVMSLKNFHALIRLTKDPDALAAYNALDPEAQQQVIAAAVRLDDQAREQRISIWYKVRCWPRNA